jgi:hypothetical protein
MVKKAIIWLCWGRPFVEQAIQSAHSAAAIGADHYLITDSDSAVAAINCQQFTDVIVADFERKNTLDKCRFIEFLPRGYDVYLYLDTDVQIIGDVSLGFSKAIQHGIAVAPAPNYNLAEYFNFARVMRELDAEPADQLIYNAGVIFFSLTSTTERVLERWRHLCLTAGDKFELPHDQPFLALAMEQCDFLPYVLSPLYNYRSFGEYAVGTIRVWHSHFPVPADVNVFETAWPARQYRDGRRVNPRAVRSRTPEKMMSLRLPQLAGRQDIGVLRQLTEEGRAVLQNQGGRAAHEQLLNSIGTEVARELNDQYVLEAAHYLLAELSAYAGQPEQMAEHMRLSQTMPSAEDDQLFSDHVNTSHALRSHQLEATERGMPSILVSCMPRSGSATLTHTLAQALDVPVFHLSAGRFPEYFLVPSWLDMFLEGGGVTQDHFGASDFNLGVLSGRKVSDLFVLIRDPRAAARSQAHHERHLNFSDEPLEDTIERECNQKFIPWLQRWIDFARHGHPPCRIHWLMYPDVATNVADVVRKIGTTLESAYPAVASVRSAQIAEVRMHFVNGDDQAWKNEVGPSVRRRMWDACTSEIRELLDLQF